MDRLLYEKKRLGSLSDRVSRGCLSIYFFWASAFASISAPPHSFTYAYLYGVHQCKDDKIHIPKHGDVLVTVVPQRNISFLLSLHGILQAGQSPVRLIAADLEILFITMAKFGFGNSYLERTDRHITKDYLLDPKTHLRFNENILSNDTVLECMTEDNEFLS